MAAAALLCAGAGMLVAAPSAVLALGVIGSDKVSASFSDGLGRFTPASIDPKLAQLLAGHDNLSGKSMRFTPAGAADRSGRSITVAVRVDEGTARALSTRQALGTPGDAQASFAAPRVAPVRYNLGLSRGYEGFVARAPAVPATGLSKTLSDASIPDLAAFKPSPGAKEKPSRLNARIALEEVQKTGRDIRSRDGLGDQTVDVGGAYSITRGIDLTAGVRYSQDRDRIEPLTNGKQDSQAVYVGTQFRF